ncbi:hypothetical protein ACGFX8_33675 [Streptomyces sp. NPDC048362]
MARTRMVISCRGLRQLNAAGIAMPAATAYGIVCGMSSVTGSASPPR